MEEKIKDEMSEEVLEEVAEDTADDKEACEQPCENKEYTELYDKYLRLLAEFENYKKRTQKEKEEVYSLAKTDIVSNLLPVIDNFDRAEKLIEDESVAEGIRLIRKQFDEFLKKLGVEEIEALGCEFDPNFHSAVLHEDVEGESENTVSEVLLKGYKLGDRVIRHAMVKVVN